MKEVKGMRSKKVLTSIAAVSIALSCLVGCGDSSIKEASSPLAAEASETSSSEDSSDASVSSDRYYTSKDYEKFIKPEWLIYEDSSSETGSIKVYYDAGTWVTLKDNELYTLQQYLVAKDKSKPISEEVVDIPGFDAGTVSYMGFDANSQQIYSFDGTESFSDLCNNNNTTGLSVYIDWQGTEGKFYTYVLQYGDVSMLYCYADESNLFRSYASYVMAMMEEQNQSKETVPADENGNPVTEEAQNQLAETVPADENSNPVTEEVAETSGETTTEATTSEENNESSTEVSE